MPQLAPYKSNVSPMDVGRIMPQRQVSAIPEGLGQLDAAIQNRRQQNGIVEASRAMAAARASWTQQITDAQNNYQPGQDFAGQIMSQFKAYHDQAVKSMSNEYGKKYLDEQLTTFGTQVAQSSIQFQAGAESAGRVQTFKEGISDAGIAVSAEPSQFESVYGEQLAALQALQIDPETKGNLATALRDTLSVSAAKAMGERDPYGTMLALSKEKTESPVLDRLSLEGREKVQDHILSVQRMLQTQDDHAMQLADKAQREASDAFLKDGIKRAKEGQLTPRWIESHHDTWEPSAYQYLYGLLEGKSSVTDPHVYAPLLERALKGEDVTEDARGALFAGQIKIDDYDRLLEKSSSPRANWVKRGVDYISTSAAVSQLNPDPAAAQRKAAMLDEWDQWVDQNPKATEAQARESYLSIVKQYALVDYQNLTLVKPVPRFAVGGRQNLDLDATESETVKAFNDGKISREEFNKQAQLLKEWRSAFELANGQPEKKK